MGCCHLLRRGPCCFPSPAHPNYDCMCVAGNQPGKKSFCCQHLHTLCVMVFSFPGPYEVNGEFWAWVTYKSEFGLYTAFVLRPDEIEETRGNNLTMWHIPFMDSVHPPRSNYGNVASILPVSWHRNMTAFWGHLFPIISIISLQKHWKHCIFFQ